MAEESAEPRPRSSFSRVGLAVILSTALLGVVLLWLVHEHAREDSVAALVERGHFVFNLLEAVFWFVIGGALGLAVWLSPRRFGANLRVARVASVLFVLFGVTDVIELWTLSFYEPWPLFALNAICVVGLLLCGLVAWWRLRRVPRIPRVPPTR